MKSARVSERVKVAGSEDRRERAVTAKQANNAACENRCLPGSLRKQQSLRQVSVYERTVCVLARRSSWKRVGKTVGPCVSVLCVDVDTVHGCCKTLLYIFGFCKTTGLPLFRSKQVCCTRT